MSNGTDPFWHDLTDQQCLTLRNAVMLAPTLDICEAILRGEKVPLSMMDPEWVARLGLK